MRWHPLVVMLVVAVSLSACARSGGDESADEDPGPSDDGPAAGAELTPEALRAGLDRVMSDLQASHADRLENMVRLPDLVPVRADIQRQVPTPQFVEFVGKVANVGDVDAGPFDVEYEAWIIDSGERDEQIIIGPLKVTERWPGVPAGATVASDEFLTEAQRLRHDITGMKLPVAVAVWYTVDPTDAANPFGEVLEQVEGANANSAIYSANENNPALPILIY